MAMLESNQTLAAAKWQNGGQTERSSVSVRRFTVLPVAIGG
jgi:hypothetical protein